MFSFFTLSSGEYELKTSLLPFRPFSLLVQGLWPAPWRKEETKRQFQLPLLFSVTVALWNLSGIWCSSSWTPYGVVFSCSVVKEVFPSFSPVGHWDERQPKMWGKVLTIFLSSAEKVAKMLYVGHILRDRLAGFKAPPSNFQFSCYNLFSDILRIIWVAGQLFHRDFMGEASNLSFPKAEGGQRVCDDRSWAPGHYSFSSCLLSFMLCCIGQRDPNGSWTEGKTDCWQIKESWRKEGSKLGLWHQCTYSIGHLLSFSLSPEWWMQGAELDSSAKVTRQCKCMFKLALWMSVNTLFRGLGSFPP